MPLRPRSFLRVKPERGIALLVTILLLSFLVLLLVAMSSLVRVESKVAANHDTVAQARQNALLGLNVALGKLQETAGPDKRLTARADLVENSIPAGSRYQMNLTGVWDRTDPSWPQPISWLINGNEDLRGQDPTLDPVSSNSATRSRTDTGANTLIFDVTKDNTDSDAHPIHSPASLRRYDDEFPPAQIFTPPGGAGEFKFGDGHVYLLGNGSLDIDPSSAAPNPTGSVPGNSYKHAIDERVIVRKSPIIIDGAKLPGRDPGPTATPTPYTVGHYAYWVGDAGVKASLSAANRYDEVNHDDSTVGGDGVDYSVNASANSLSPDYVGRKLLNGMQLQGNRYDLLFRPEPGEGDIFRQGQIPSFLLAPSSPNVSNTNRLQFYGASMHPAYRDLIKGLNTASQLQYGAFFAFSNPQFSVASTNLPTPPDYQIVINHRLKQLFHDVTPQTYGVLTNMRLGGLRYDLSYLGRAKYNAVADYNSAVTAIDADSSLSTADVNNLTGGLETFANVWRPLKVNAGQGSEPVSVLTKPGLLRLQVPLVAPPAAQFSVTSGVTSYPLVPVISELSVIGTFKSDGDGALRVGVAGEVELWNPYNAELYYPATQSLRLTMDVVRAGVILLQDLEVDDTGNGFRSAVSLARSLGWNGTDPDFSVTVNLTGGSPAANSRRWAPGRISKWSFTLLANETFGLTPSGSQTSGYTINASDFSINHPTATDTVLNLKLLLRSGGSDFDLYSIANVNLGFVPSSLQTNLFQYYLRLNEDSDYTAAAWLTQMNPLGPTIAARAGGGGTVATYSTKVIIDSGTPAAPTLDSPTTNLLLLNDSTTGSTPVIIADVPRQDLVGIGALRHLVVNPAASTRTNSIATKGAGNPNNIFEDFFVSTIPGDQNAWALKSGDPLPNSSMVVFDPTPGGNTPLADLWRDTTPPANTSLKGLQSEASAQYLLVKDAFNINSTSIPAWRALLGGVLPTLADASDAAPDGDDYFWNSPDLSANWRYFDGTFTDKTIPLRNAFFRFPQTAPDVGEDYFTPGPPASGWKTLLQSGTAATRKRAAYRVGIRELTNDQVDELAWNLVDLLKARGRPFESVTDFVDTGLIQDAINLVGTSAYGGPSNARINEIIAGQPLPEASSAFLSQGDILELVGHRLFARSDTFIIRVYGDVTEPTVFTRGSDSGHLVPKVTSRVWLEATVQRTPIKHPTADDPDDNMTPTNPAGAPLQVGNFGRQFRILNIRWLRPDEV